MERPKASTMAWSAITAGVLAYDMFCPPGDTLSEATDRALERHPILTRCAIGTVALHLINALPDRLDPLHYAVKFVKVKPIARDYGSSSHS